MTAPDRLTLAIDVGNSRFKMGLFRRGDVDADGLPECLGATAVPLAEDLPWALVDEWNDGTPADAVTDAVTGVVAGANPAGVRKVLASWPTDRCGTPHVLDDPARFPLDVALPAPELVGVDRLLNAIAANVVRAPLRSCIVVDAGTATTVDCVSPGGSFRGGAILPGFELSSRSLHLYTALLPEIEVEDVDATTVPPLGTDTKSALRSGLFWGHLGAVRELIERMSADESETPTVLLTGGGAILLAGLLPNAEWQPHLTLQGLVLAAESEA